MDKFHLVETELKERAMYILLETYHRLNALDAEKNLNILSWEGRIRIALDSAQGWSL